MGGPDLGMRPVAVAPLMLLLFSLPLDIASAQVPARVAPPYTLMDAETRTYIEGGVEVPLKGNGPTTGYGYLFYTRPHVLAEDLYLRLVVPPGYFISELILDHFPSQNSALGVGVSGGFFAESQTEFQEGRTCPRSRSPATRPEARSPTTCGVRKSSASCRSRARSAPIRNTSGTTAATAPHAISACPRTPRSTTCAWGPAGGGSAGALPQRRDRGVGVANLQLPRQRRALRLRAELQETDHFTQRTWTRLGATYTFGVQQASAFFNAGIAENTDALSTFRMGGGLRLRAEFPLLLHGFYVEEVFARSFWLMNFAYRFPIWPGQDLVHLQLLADVAQVNYIQGHQLPRSTLAGVGVNLSVAVTKRIDLVVGYGYGINAPRGNGFGGQEFDAQFQLKF